MLTLNCCLVVHCVPGQILYVTPMSIRYIFSSWADIFIIDVLPDQVGSGLRCLRHSSVNRDEGCWLMYGIYTAFEPPFLFIIHQKIVVSALQQNLLALAAIFRDKFLFANML